MWNLCSRFEDGSNGSVTACGCVATKDVPCDLCCRAHSGSDRPILLGEQGAVVTGGGDRRHLENGTSPPCSRRQFRRGSQTAPPWTTGKSRATFSLDGDGDGVGVAAELHEFCHRCTAPSHTPWAMAPPTPTIRVVDWGTLAGTALGAILGVSTTLLAERSRWQREHSARERAVRQQLYAEYLGALSLTTHRLRDLKRSNGLTREERMEQAGEILGSTNAYHLRYQMLIIAPEHLGNTADQAFMRLRDLRDRFDEPDIGADPGWPSAMDALDGALNALRTAMRSDVGARA